MWRVDKDSNQPVSGPLGKPQVPLYSWSNLGGYEFDCHEVYGDCSRRCTDRDRISHWYDIDMMECTASPPIKKKKAVVRSERSRRSSTAIQQSAAKCALPSFDSVNFGNPVDPLLGVPSALKKKADPRPIMALVMLQNASGSWDLTDKLVSLCGTNKDALIKGCPKEIAVDTGEGKLLWATAEG